MRAYFGRNVVHLTRIAFLAFLARFARVRKGDSRLMQEQDSVTKHTHTVRLAEPSKFLKIGGAHNGLTCERGQVHHIGIKSLHL